MQFRTKLAKQKLEPNSVLFSVFLYLRIFSLFLPFFLYLFLCFFCISVFTFAKFKFEVTPHYLCGKTVQ